MNGKQPRHIAIIMDGNGRWAKQRGLDRPEGHRNAIEAVRDTITSAAELGIEYLTLYTFSTENWNRPQTEVHALMSLLVQSIENETPTMLKNGVRFTVIGDMDRMPSDVRMRLDKCVRDTAGGKGLTLILALSYSARWEITRAMRRAVMDARNGTLKVEDVDDNVVRSYLTTSGVPDPDLLIRTGGDIRVSNFLLWQIAYSELYFTDVLWPDFRKCHLLEAIEDFQRRQRRFGLTEQQIEEKENNDDASFSKPL